MARRPTQRIKIDTLPELVSLREGVRAAFYRNTKKRLLVTNNKDNPYYDLLLENINEITGIKFDIGTLRKFFYEDKKRSYQILTIETLKKYIETDLGKEVTVRSNVINEQRNEEAIESKNNTKTTSDRLFKIDDELQILLKDIEMLIENYSFTDAEELYKKGFTTANNKNDDYGKAKLNILYAKIIIEKEEDKQLAKYYLDQSLLVLKRLKIDNEEIVNTKYVLAGVECDLGDYLTAESYINEYLDCYSTSRKNIFNIGNAYNNLAILEIYKGHLDKAFDYIEQSTRIGTRLSKLVLESEIKNGILLLAESSSLKFLIFRMRGEISEAKYWLRLSIKWHKEIHSYKHLSYKFLNLAELDFIEGNFTADHWLEYIKEAKSYIRIYKNSEELAKCIVLIADLAYRHQAYSLLFQILSDGYKEILDTGNKDALEYYLSNYGSYLNKVGRYKDAEHFILKQIEIASEGKHLLQAYITLSEIEMGKGNLEGRRKYLNIVLKVLENKNLSEKSIINRAKNLALISDTYYALGELRISLDKNYQAFNIYKSLNFVGQITERSFRIAKIYKELGDNENAFQYFLKVSNLVKGRGFYELNVLSNIFCAYYYFSLDNEGACQRCIDEASFLNNKHMFGYNDLIDGFKEMLGTQKSTTNISKYAFEEMINCLFEGVNSKKANFDQVLRLWFYIYTEELFDFAVNYPGLKAALYSDNLNQCDLITKNLNWLFDYFFILTISELEKGGLEEKFVYPFPFKSINVNKASKFYYKIQTGVDIAAGIPSKKAKHIDKEDELLETIKKPLIHFTIPQYRIIIPKDEDDTQSFVEGVKFNLPKIAYDFFDNKVASEIIMGNSLVLPREPIIEKRVYYNISHCIKSGAIPVYINEELQFENISVLDKLDIAIPFGDNIDRNMSIKIKGLLNSLKHIEKMKAKSALIDFKINIENLTFNSTNKIHLTIIIAGFDFYLKATTYPIIILHLGNKPQ